MAPPAYAAPKVTSFTVNAEPVHKVSDVLDSIRHPWELTAQTDPSGQQRIKLTALTIRRYLPKENKVLVAKVPQDYLDIINNNRLPDGALSSEFLRSFILINQKNIVAAYEGKKSRSFTVEIVLPSAAPASAPLARPVQPPASAPLPAERTIILEQSLDALARIIGPKTKLTLDPNVIGLATSYLQLVPLKLTEPEVTAGYKKPGLIPSISLRKPILPPLDYSYATRATKEREDDVDRAAAQVAASTRQSAANEVARKEEAQRAIAAASNQFGGSIINPQGEQGTEQLRLARDAFENGRYDAAKTFANKAASLAKEGKVKYEEFKQIQKTESELTSNVESARVAAINSKDSGLMREIGQLKLEFDRLQRQLAAADGSTDLSKIKSELASLSSLVQSVSTRSQKIIADNAQAAAARQTRTAAATKKAEASDAQARAGTTGELNIARAEIYDKGKLLEPQLSSALEQFRLAGVAFNHKEYAGAVRFARSAGAIAKEGRARYVEYDSATKVAAQVSGEIAKAKDNANKSKDPALIREVASVEQTLNKNRSALGTATEQNNANFTSIQASFAELSASARSISARAQAVIVAAERKAAAATAQKQEAQRTAEATRQADAAKAATEQKARAEQAQRDAQYRAQRAETDRKAARLTMVRGVERAKFSSDELLFASTHKIAFSDGGKGTKLNPTDLGLKAILEFLKQNPGAKVSIEAHTDSHLTRDLPTAKALTGRSLLQAKAVWVWLNDHGIAENRLSAAGFGATKPIVPNLTPSNREKNRRVEFRIVGEVAVAARAAPPDRAAPAAAAETQRAGDAREHHKRATALYDTGKYDEAVAEFQAAYKINDNPVLLYNIGQSYRLAQKYSDALKAYQEYLRKSPKAPNRDEVETKISDMENLIAQTTRRAAPERAAEAERPAPAIKIVTREEVNLALRAAKTEFIKKEKVFDPENSANTTLTEAEGRLRSGKNPTDYAAAQALITKALALRKEGIAKYAEYQETRQLQERATSEVKKTRAIVERANDTDLNGELSPLTREVNDIDEKIKESTLKDSDFAGMRSRSTSVIARAKALYTKTEKSIVQKAEAERVAEEERKAMKAARVSADQARVEAGQHILPHIGNPEMAQAKKDVAEGDRILALAKNSADYRRAQALFASASTKAVAATRSIAAAEQKARVDAAKLEADRAAQAKEAKKKAEGAVGDAEKAAENLRKLILTDRTLLEGEVRTQATLVSGKFAAAKKALGAGDFASATDLANESSKAASAATVAFNSARRAAEQAQKPVAKTQAQVDAETARDKAQAEIKDGAPQVALADFERGQRILASKTPNYVEAKTAFETVSSIMALKNRLNDAHEEVEVSNVQQPEALKQKARSMLSAAERDLNAKRFDEAQQKINQALAVFKTTPAAPSRATTPAEARPQVAVPVRDKFNLENARKHYVRGSDFVEQDQYARAIDEFKLAIESTNKPVPIYYDLAKAYAKIKNTDEAINYYSAYIQNVGASRNLADAREQLAALQAQKAAAIAAAQPGTRAPIAAAPVTRPAPEQEAVKPHRRLTIDEEHQQASAATNKAMLGVQEVLPKAYAEIIRAQKEGRDTDAAISIYNGALNAYGRGFSISSTDLANRKVAWDDASKKADLAVESAKGADKTYLLPLPVAKWDAVEDLREKSAWVTSIRAAQQAIFEAQKLRHDIKDAQANLDQAIKAYSEGTRPVTFAERALSLAKSSRTPQENQAYADATRVISDAQKQMVVAFRSGYDILRAKQKYDQAQAEFAKKNLAGFKAAHALAAEAIGLTTSTVSKRERIELQFSVGPKPYAKDPMQIELNLSGFPIKTFSVKANSEWIAKLGNAEEAKKQIITQLLARVNGYMLSAIDQYREATIATSEAKLIDEAIALFVSDHAPAQKPGRGSPAVEAPSERPAQARTIDISLGRKTFTIAFSAEELTANNRTQLTELFVQRGHAALEKSVPIRSTRETMLRQFVRTDPSFARLLSSAKGPATPPQAARAAPPAPQEATAEIIMGKPSGAMHSIAVSYLSARGTEKTVNVKFSDAFLKGKTPGAAATEIKDRVENQSGRKFKAKEAGEMIGLISNQLGATQIEVEAEAQGQKTKNIDVIFGSKGNGFEYVYKSGDYDQENTTFRFRLVIIEGNLREAFTKAKVPIDQIDNPTVNSRVASEIIVKARAEAQKQGFDMSKFDAIETIIRAEIPKAAKQILGEKSMNLQGDE
ncbi:OmpA family protein [Candidatus Micrarchaeota archaeon]|nr:OmpA family protein [Candidatus Micrarchaeota archaeon]